MQINVKWNGHLNLTKWSEFNLFSMSLKINPQYDLDLRNKTEQNMADSNTTELFI